LNGEHTKQATDRCVKEALEYDPLHEAERATGKHWSESETTGLIGMALALEHNRHKAKVLAATDDTHFGQTLQQWNATIERLGFEKVLDEPIEGTGDRYRIWWRSGVLLSSDSYYDDTSVNSANAYLNYRGPRDGMYGSSNGHIADVDGAPVWDCGKDAREGFRFFLTRLEASGEILPVWIKQPFLWLLHYKDSKQPNYDYKTISADRIARLPEHVRSALSVK